MTTIWKYPIEFIERQSVHMPIGAQILAAELQNNILCLWALGDPELPQHSRHIQVAGTGQPLSDDYTRKHISTVTVNSAGIQLVWHIFELFL